MSRKMKELLSEVVQTDFHTVASEEWDAVFDKLLILQGSDNPEIVEEALRWTGRAIWAGQCGLDYDPHADRDIYRERLTIFLARLARRTDAVDRVLGLASHVRSMARDNESRASFLEWVDNFRPPPDSAKKWNKAALIVRLQLDAFGDDLTTASPHLTDLLDHASLQVRAYAAAALGRLITGKPIGHTALGNVLRDIHDRETERPGIAGPLYGVICYDLKELPGDGRASIKAWMLSIIENRKAPEPSFPGFHFIGIDFHAHQLFADDPDGVRELMRIGRTDIAVAAATDKDRIVEGMEDVLVELGNSNEEGVCRSASWQLAYLYRILHPNGQERGFVSGIPLSGGEELFLNGYPDNPRFPYAAILYSPAGRSFTSDVAHHWIDRLLPANIRGAALSFYPEGWPGETVDGGQVSGNQVNFRWACEALGTLKGDVSARQWDSLTIIWQGEKEVWVPGDYVAG